MKLIPLLLSIAFASFKTCPQLFQSRSTCEAQSGCVYYDWKISTCYYNCINYTQDQCILLFNCKWQDSECKFKSCLDYTSQGKSTCANTPGCNWFWNKCRQQNCENLGAGTQAACSKTYCVWDEINTKCVNKQCADFEKSICQQVSQCSWESESCVDTVVSSFCYRLLVLILILLF